MQVALHVEAVIRDPLTSSERATARLVEVTGMAIGPKMEDAR
jgi:hypothetical protein